MMPVILTLWGEHETDEGQALANIIDTMPLIVALRIKVSSYHSEYIRNSLCSTYFLTLNILIIQCTLRDVNIAALNLSTKFGSSILLNPPIQQAADLKHW